MTTHDDPLRYPRNCYTADSAHHLQAFVGAAVGAMLAVQPACEHPFPYEHSLNARCFYYVALRSSVLLTANNMTNILPCNAVALDIPNPFQGSIEETREASKMPANRSKAPLIPKPCFPSVCSPSPCLSANCSTM
jgi:hypothetical protein